MSISVFVEGLREKDETYKKHTAVLQACIDADIEELPKETTKYFNCKYADINDIDNPLSVDIPYEEDYDDNSSYWIVNVADIPESVKQIKFSMG